MVMKHKRLFALSCFFVIAISLIMPAYADVLTFKTDKTFYKKGDKIIFSGIVEKGDFGELVTIVIDDPSGEFVRLAQAYPDIDDKFQVTVDTQPKFLSHGIYNATAFLTNKTNGIMINFDFLLDGSPVIHPEPVVESGQETEEGQPQQEDAPASDTEPTPNSKTNGDEKSIQEKIKERIEAAKKLKESPNPLDETNENIINQTVSNSSITTNGETSVDNSGVDENKLDTTNMVSATDLGHNLLYVVIGLGVTGVVGAVIYGMKHKSRRKTDHSSRFTSEEKNESLQKTTTQSEDDYALMILKNRLAKGEITIDEFNELKKALKEP